MKSFNDLIGSIKLVFYQNGFSTDKPTFPVQIDRDKRDSVIFFLITAI
jgi:hypothetical protein